MQASFRLNTCKHTLGLILSPYEIRSFPPSILFVCLCMRSGASDGFSLSLKCERRQSTALPRTHSRTRSKKKTAGFKPAILSKFFRFLRDTAVSAFNSFGFIRVCTAEPRPDFRCRSNANDGKAWLCRVLPRGLAPKRYPFVFINRSELIRSSLIQFIILY